MAQQIWLEGYSLQSDTIITQKFDHEGLQIDQSKLKIPHRSGEKFVSYTYATRSISLDGNIVNTTASGQDSTVDTFKKNVIGAMDNQLRFDYKGGSLNRAYQVNVTNVILPRDYYNLTLVPFSIQCEAVDPPFAYDYTVIHMSPMTQSGKLDTIMTLSGNAPLVPIITITQKNSTQLHYVIVENFFTDTSLMITPSGTMSINKEIVIDMGAFICMTDSTETDLGDMTAAPTTGVYPTFIGGDEAELIVIPDNNGTSYEVKIDYYPRWL